MNIGKSIKKFRKEKGMNQEFLADLSGISQTALSQIETGFSLPHQKTLDNICKHLEISEYLLRMLSLEESDIPESRHELFKKAFPIIQDLIIGLFYEGDLNK